VEIEGQWVHFQIQHVFYPPPEALLLELFGNRLLQGRVLTTTPGGQAGEPELYAAVAVDDVREPVVVPIDRLRPSLLGLESPVEDEPTR